MVTGTYERRGKDGRISAVRQKPIQHAHELFCRLDMGHMAGRELHRGRMEQGRELTRRLDRQWVERTGNHEGWWRPSSGEGRTNPFPQVVVAETLPHRLLSALGDAERRQPLRHGWVPEVRRHR